MGKTIEYEIITVDGEWCASSTNLVEALHYAKVYGQDGKVEIFKVVRSPLMDDIENNPPKTDREPTTLDQFLHHIGKEHNG